MQYIGGKYRIARQILPIILAGRKPGQFYAEPFLGGGNTFARVSNPRVGTDNNPFLIAFWKASLRGWVPADFSREEYAAAKACPGACAPEQFFWYGTAHCVSRKWFSGYWERDVKSRRYYGLSFAQEFWRSVERKLPLMRGARLACADYRKARIPAGAIVYCDPPYAGQTGAPYFANGFGHAEFWAHFAELSKRHRVFVSEREAPPDWRCVWSQEIQVSNNQLNSKGKSSARAMERLFVHRDGLAALRDREVAAERNFLKRAAGKGK